jgi:ADP-ribose pyrophosphatase YjhB (NUDIX family)
MAGVAIPTWAFALVVVRLGHRVLLVHERKHGQTWYLPAGRVEPGETLMQAAKRETLEESGVDVVLDGVVAVEHRPLTDGAARLRAIFVASPAHDETPRTVPNEHSLGAAWVTVEDMDSLNLRTRGVRDLAASLLAGRPTYPLSLLRPEADPWLG